MTMRITDEVKDRLGKIQEENQFNSLSEAVDFLIQKNSPTGETFYKWLSEIIPWSQIDKHVLWTDHGDRTNAKIYTQSHAYSITYRHDGGYLGCIASTTFHRPGENWTRGSDLPDGPFDRKTWDAIKNAIIKYELQELSAFVRDGEQRVEEDEVTIKDEFEAT